MGYKNKARRLAYQREYNKVKYKQMKDDKKAFAGIQAIIDGTPYDIVGQQRAIREAIRAVMVRMGYVS